MLEHGGRLDRAAREYGIPREQWLDLSTGVSPFAYPVPTIPTAAWHRLPEDDDGLVEAGRRYYGAEHLLPVAGSQAAIAALPRCHERSRVAVVEPAYAEHAHAWRQAGHDVVALPMQDLFARAGEFDVVIVVRPNNPTGECPARESLLHLHRHLQRRHPVGAASAANLRRASHPVGAASAARGARGTVAKGLAAEAAPTRAAAVPSGTPWLIVDEAFIDVRPNESLCGEAREGLIVLRSVGKFFGLAGARVGFVAAWPALLDVLEETLGPWTLTGPARHVVMHALADELWHASVRERLRLASDRLLALLRRHGLSPTGGCEFFQYVERPDAAALRDALARRAVLVRHFDIPGALRFGLPGEEDAFVHLDRALTDVLA